jgi:hypothetical protein
MGSIKTLLPDTSLPTLHSHPGLNRVYGAEQFAPPMLYVDTLCVSGLRLIKSNCRHADQDPVGSL